MNVEEPMRVCGATPAVAFVLLICCQSVAVAEDLTLCYQGYDEHYQSGDLHAAIDLYTRCVENGDLSVEHEAVVVLQRGNAWLRLGEPKRAIEDYSRALLLNPHYAGALTNRGAAWLATGQHRLAIQDFDAALAMEPENPELLNNAAWVRYVLGMDLAQALVLAQRANQISPDDRGVADTLGHVLAGLGLQEESMAAFERAIVLSSPDQIAKFEQGLKHQQYDPGPTDGDWDAASRAALEACVQDACNVWAE